MLNNIFRKQRRTIIIFIDLKREKIVPKIELRGSSCQAFQVWLLEFDPLSLVSLHYEMANSQSAFQT